MPTSPDRLGRGYDGVSTAHRALLALAILTAGPALPARQAGGAEPGRGPNVVLILIDDLGWADLGCYGSDFYETPQIDRLARDGMRFTDAYAACNCCSPTRAAVLTGKYPARLHLTDWIPGTTFPDVKLRPPLWTQALPLEEVTLAESLRAAGYATAAVGKWHLGQEPSLPQNQGFDLNIAGNHSGAPGSYFWPYAHNDPAKANRYHGGPVPDVYAGGRDGEYLTDRLTDEALRFIEAQRDRPFFLYLAHYAVHTPLQAKEDLEAKYRAKVNPDHPQKNPTYAAMIESVDQSVGRLLAKLDALALSNRTVVLFTSDNGGFLGATANTPLRGGKGQKWEGGIRVPLIVRWPPAVPAGSICHEPVSSIDLFPTILDMAGVAERVDARKPAAHIDGVSLVPVLKQQGSLLREALYWHYPHYNVMAKCPHGIIRQGDYKLIESYEDGQLELYNLRDDLGEANNLAAALPDQAAALRDKLHRWREAVGAQMPLPNPKYVRGAP